MARWTKIWGRCNLIFGSSVVYFPTQKFCFCMQVASNSSQNVELMLQESCTDESGSLVAYTTVDLDAIQLAMNGEDPSCIPLLPLGFVIVPVGHTNHDSTVNLPAGDICPDPIQEYAENGNNLPDSGCLLTVGLQVLASTNPSAKLNLSSVTAINNHICNTVHQINAALNGAARGSSTGGNCADTGSIVVSSSTEPPAAPPKEPDQPSTTP